MIQLKSIEDKLVKLSNRVSRNDYLELKVSKEEFELLIKTEMIRQVADFLMPRITFKTTMGIDGSFDLSAEGYFFTQDELYLLLAEVSELSDEDKQDLIQLSKKDPS